MSLPSLATVDDIEARAPDLTVDETQAVALLADASALIRAEANRGWVNDAGTELEGVPDGIPGICARMVIRVLRGGEDGIRQESEGNYNVTYADTGLYLKATEKRFIARAVGQGGPFSISTYGEVGYLGTTEDVDWL